MNIFVLLQCIPKIVMLIENIENLFGLNEN